MTDEDRAAAMSTEWTEAIVVAEGEWRLPAGAYRGGAGPS